MYQTKNGNTFVEIEDINLRIKNEIVITIKPLWEIQNMMITYEVYRYYNFLCAKSPPSAWHDVTGEEVCLKYRLLTDLKGKHGFAQETKYGDLIVRYLRYPEAKKVYYDVILKRRREEEERDKAIMEKFRKYYKRKETVNDR